MPGKFRLAALFLLLVAILAITFAGVEYQRCSGGCKSLYTRSVKKRDVVDGARNALEAVTDAEIREQDYVLTGETVYLEAYKEDLQTAQDELGALALVARNDSAALPAQEMSRAGGRTLEELAAVISTYEKNGRDAALDRIHNTSSAVYLNQLRRNADDILAEDGGQYDLTNVTFSRTFQSVRRMAVTAAILFCVAAGGAFIAFQSGRVRK